MGFIVKRLPFSFVAEDGPTYQAAAGERVWLSSDNVPPPAEYKHETDLGLRPVNCQVGYTIIDDDLDGRINTFSLDGVVIHNVAEGMVTSGGFVLPHDGRLVFSAIDSVGVYFSFSDCNRLTPTPDPTQTLTPTLTLIPTGTATFTPTLTLTITQTLTPTGTVTPDPTQTLTPTLTLIPTGTATPTATVRPYKGPRLPACLNVNLELAGQVAKRGWYTVYHEGGAIIAQFYMLEGWQDSGIVWSDIPYESVYVYVTYRAFLADPEVVLTIVNPVPDHPEGLNMGWLKRGVCHALEVSHE